MVDETEDAPAQVDMTFDPFALNAGLSKLYEDELFTEDEYDEEEPDGGQGGQHSTPAINEGDFLDPAEHAIFIHLKKQIRVACNVASKPANRRKAAEWIFVPNEEDAAGHSFELICRALGARPGVLRARTIYQLWNAGITLPEPLPFLSATPPVSLMSEVSALVGSTVPEKMARESWFWPSIPATELRSKMANVNSKTYTACMEAMIAHGYIGISASRVYFICRNPSLLTSRERNRFSFSASIYGD